MKKVILALVMVLALMGVAMAQESINVGDLVQKLPGLKQGAGFSLIENEVNYLTTIELVNFKGFALEGGYNSKDKIVAVISADLINLKKLGCTVPILDLIDLRIGVYGGYGSINSQEIDNSEWDAGLSLTAISVKF